MPCSSWVGSQVQKKNANNVGCFSPRWGVVAASEILVVSHCGGIWIVLQDLSGKGLSLGIAVLPWTLLVSHNMKGAGVWFGDPWMSVGQDYFHTTNQPRNCVAELLPFSVLVVSLCLYPSVVSCLIFWWGGFWSSREWVYLHSDFLWLPAVNLLFTMSLQLKELNAPFIHKIKS